MTSTTRKIAHEAREQRRKAQTRYKIAMWIGGALAAIGFFILILGNTPGIGANTPNFTAAMLDGSQKQLSDFRGKVVMLNFWATWCPPCRAEMPDIQAAYEYYADQGLVVLAINNGESPEQINPFLRALELNFPVALDQSGRIAQQFGIRSFPTSIFIGPDGAIYATHTGLIYPQQLDAYIRAGLAKMG